MTTINDKFRVKNGFRVDNEAKENIFEVNDAAIEAQRTIFSSSESAETTPIIVKSRDGQTADLQKWKDFLGNDLARIDKDGHMYASKITTDDSIVIGGNLTVNGTTTTINSIISSTDDPVLLLGGDTEPTQDDSKDRGIEFRWHNGAAAKTGFFGFDNFTNRFTFIPESINDGEIFSGTLGDIEVKDIYLINKISTLSQSFEILNTNAVSIMLGGEATDIQIGSLAGVTNIRNNLDVNGDIHFNGGNLTTGLFSVNILNTNATTINFGGDATDIQMGSSSGTTSINNNLDISGDVSIDGGDVIVSTETFNLANDTATSINFGGAATDIQIGSSIGTTKINNGLDVSGDLSVSGGDISVGTSNLNLANDTATTINFGGAATDIQIGSNGGTTNINNSLDVDGDVCIDGGNLMVTSNTFNLANTVATTVNIGGSATNIQLGSTTGTTNINNNLSVDGDITLDGGDIISNTSILNLANTGSTSINFGGAATDIQIGSSTGTTNINNNLDVDGDVTINGGDLKATTAIFNLLDTAATINFGVAATDIQIGSNTGITNVNNDLEIDGDVIFKGGDIRVTTLTANVINTTATTVNFAGAATELSLGSTTGTTTVRNNLKVKEGLTIEGQATIFSPPIADTPAFTIGLNAFDVLVSGLNSDKLDGQTGSWYQSRGNHTGTQQSTTISDWSEAVQDIVGPMLVHSQQSGISALYNDDTGRVLLTVTGGGSGGGGDFSMTYWMGV